jgi:hypothetical protein
MDSKLCRVRADECERRSQEASAPALKAQWAELTLEWHNVARLLAGNFEQNELEAC